MGDHFGDPVNLDSDLVTCVQTAVNFVSVMQSSPTGCVDKASYRAVVSRNGFLANEFQALRSREMSSGRLPTFRGLAWEVCQAAGHF